MADTYIEPTHITRGAEVFLVVLAIQRYDGVTGRGGAWLTWPIITLMITLNMILVNTSCEEILRILMCIVKDAISRDNRKKVCLVSVLGRSC